MEKIRKSGLFLFFTGDNSGLRGIAQFQYAGACVVGLGSVKDNAIFPEGAATAVDDVFDVAVAWVSTAMNDSEYVEARFFHAVHEVFYGGDSFARDITVEIDFFFREGKFPGGGATAHVFPAGAFEGVFRGCVCCF